MVTEKVTGPVLVPEFGKKNGVLCIIQHVPREVQERPVYGRMSVGTQSWLMVTLEEAPWIALEPVPV